MIADARTNPFTWRRCIHALLGLSGRCDDCGAIRDTFPFRQRKHPAGVDSPVTGTTDYALDDEALTNTVATCKYGHVGEMAGNRNQRWCRKCNRIRKGREPKETPDA